MSNIRLHQKALTLRKLGRSYSQIRNETGVSKSTLSGWLKKHPLSKEQLILLRDVNQSRIERFRKTMQSKRDKKLNRYYNEQKKTILPLSKKELLVAGLFLYWGEGGKTEKGLVSISNTDPAVLKFSILWFKEALEIL